MSVQCQILIQRPKRGIYKRGEEVRGIVKMFIDDPTEYKHNVLSLIGRTGSYWVCRRPSNASSNIFTPINIFENIPDTGVPLEGEYEYPFRFLLNHSKIPSAIKIWFTLAQQSSDILKKEILLNSFVHYKPIQVAKHVYFFPSNFFRLKKSLFVPYASRKQNEVILEGSIEEAIWTPGAHAHLSYLVNNDTDVDILSVRTELYSYNITHLFGLRTTKVERVDLQDRELRCETLSILARKVERIPVALPIPADLHTLMTKAASQEYELRVTVRLPLPHLNATVKVPVLIGDEEDFDTAEFQIPDIADLERHEFQDTVEEMALGSIVKLNRNIGKLGTVANNVDDEELLSK